MANPADGTWLLIEADAISDNGWVAGIGTFTPSGGAPYTRGWVAQLNLLPGDYNGNGIVDAADYTVWHDHLGQNFSLQNRDPNASGEINGTDYDFWVSHFGDTGSGAGSTAGQASSGTQAGVPEPSTMSLMVVAMTGCIVRMAARPALRRRVAKGGLPR
ncbi:MAG TPA: dockerin type I domain-containing protein [Lacipirellulaceae bacterium]